MNHTNRQFCIEVWGDYACFTRPEMKVERVSYDVITPSAARAVFETIFWKPAIRWHVQQIEVLCPVRWISVRRNEVKGSISDRAPHLFIEDNRQQRAGLFLRDVHYRLRAELEYLPPHKRPKVSNPVPEALQDTCENQQLSAPAGVSGHCDENPGKYNAIFERRARKGQCFTQPYLGCREFSAHYRYIEQPDDPVLAPPIAESRDLGFMLYDLDFDTNPATPPALFFRATMEQGVIRVPAKNSKEVLK